MAAKALRPVEAEVFQGTTRIGINRRGKNEQRPGAAFFPTPRGRSTKRSGPCGSRRRMAGRPRWCFPVPVIR